MDILSIIGIIIGLIILFLIISVVTLQLDLASYTATGAETLTPSGTSVENALVIYSPGVTGAAKKAATEIANDLKSKGYNVTLAGVRNSAAKTTSDYDIIITGGPMYFGKVSSSIDGYLKTLKVPENVKLGVFGTTGTDDVVQENTDSLKAQVASFQSGNVTIKTIRDSAENVAQDCQDLVSALV